MNAIYWSTDRSGPSVESGTYRAEDGRLVHCRRRSLHELVIEVEGDDIPHVALSTLTAGLVRLSDDPDWPDWDHRGAIAGAFVD